MLANITWTDGSGPAPDWSMHPWSGITRKGLRARARLI